MRVILTGTRSFGVAALRMLHETGHDVVGTVAPDGDKVWWESLRLGLECAREMDHKWVAGREADIIVGAHSHAFIGRKSRAATRLGAIGYHPSLLPRHRGKDAVEWTIRMGDPIAGGSVYWFTDHIDGGPIAAQDYCFVGRSETASALWRDKLFPMGIDLLRGVLHDLDNGRIVRQEQNEKYATWEPSIDSPPLYRPELPALGTIDPAFTVVASRQA